MLMNTKKGRISDLGPFLWSCRESNPLVYQGFCLLSGSFIPPRSDSFPLVTCGFLLEP
jgi:hypothetical protein